MAKTHAFSKKLQPYPLFFLSSFKKIICIQYHFAFLVGYRLVVFLCSILCFQPLKPHFLIYVLPLLNHVLMVRKGFVHLLDVHFYAFHLAFSSILPCVQHQNALRLAPKRLAFSTKMQCVQHQNAVRLAPKCSAISTKMQCVQHQNALHLAANRPKSGTDCGFMQCVFILLAFTYQPFLHHNKPSRESFFCGRAGDWWIARALIMLKFMLKILQKMRCGARTLRVCQLIS